MTGQYAVDDIFLPC